MYKFYNEKLKWDRSNLKLGLQYSSIVGVIIQVTANFALALRSKPITSDLGKTIWLSEFLVAGSRCQDTYSRILS